MNVAYSDQPIQLSTPSIFLAGPTPRSDVAPSWRPAALDLLRVLGFDGTVLVPERQDWKAGFDYLNQVEWEHAGLEGCDVIVFWVPRDVTSLPGFTTNVEFGRYVGRKACVYGRPEGAPHTRYLDWLYTKVTGLPPLSDFLATLTAAVRAVRPAGKSP
jgi:hypothetical protein